MSRELAEQLSMVAREEGAAGLAMTGVDRFDDALAALRSQIASGRSGPLRFTYDDPMQATDVTRSFPWARSLLVFGWDYVAAAGTPADRGAVVARFATSDHYQGARRVANAISTLLRASGHRAEPLIDDNRLVDRAAANRAGLGWAGKSTMLLTPGHGPWMLLGTVVTDASLPPDAPMRRDCGSCDACIPACPTGALGPAGLDARRCLSTWLQAPGSIPQWIRPLLGRRIYGCDDCLTACPPGFRALAVAGEQPVELPFAELLRSTDEELLDRFSWWYVPRRQGRFIRRNLLVAAGNSSESEAREAVTTHMVHQSSMIRGHAYWAMARAFDGRDQLREALIVETVPEARDELLLALLMAEDVTGHGQMLAAEEWARGDRAIRGLALVGPRAEGEDPGPGNELELVHLKEGDHVPRGLRLPFVRIYDPDRSLERLRREMQA